MAKTTLEMSVKYRFWVIPLLYVSSFIYAARGKKDFPDSFLDWIVKHGVKIELSE